MRIKKRNCRNKGTKVYGKLILKKPYSFYIFLMNYNSEQVIFLLVKENAHVFLKQRF